MRVRLNNQRLAALIAASALTQNHWAIRVGLSRGHWSDIVNGNHPFPSAKTRKLILDAFGVPLEELFEIDATGDAWADVDFRRAMSDRYIIDAEVGQGGMGAVYLARDVRHGRLVAIKVIAPEAVSGVGIVQFQREISTVAKLLHPNILPLHESGEIGGQPYFVMPFVRGGSLRALLERETRLPVGTVSTMVRGISAALQHAHDERVLHCDIKPENILLFGEHAWVTDFGIARRLHSDAQEWPRQSGLDISAGTPAYVSPEQAAGEPDLDARSDVFSLGCVVYEMLTGRSPFEGSNTQQVVARRFAAPPPPLRTFAPDVPVAVAVVVERAMALRREDRHDSATMFASEFAQAARASAHAAARAMFAFWRGVTIAERGLRLTSRNPLGALVRSVAEDLRFAIRVNIRNRAVTAAIVATMIIGIAVTTSIFSAVNGVLLRPLPFRDSDRVVQLSMVLRNGNETPMLALPDVEDFRRDAQHFSDFTTATLGGTTLLRGDTPQALMAANVDSAYAHVFALAPVAGRFFSAADYESSAPATALISYGLWQRVFGGDSSVIGQSITLGNAPVTVLGVLASSPYTFPYPGIDIIRPLVLQPGSYPANRGALWLRVAAKMKPGVSVSDGRAEILSLARRIELAYPDAYKGLSFRVTALHTAEVGDASAMLWLLAGAVGVVLLIACVNIANVLLAQSHARSREFAVRAALGGSARRIRRQLFTESLVLTVAGGAAGIALAPFVTRALVALYPGSLPRAGEIGVDARVLFVAVAAMIGAGLAAGWPTARRAVAHDLTKDLRSGTRTGASRGHRRIGNALVIAQVALSLALVFSAGVLVRTFRDLTLADVGFRGAGVVTFHLSPSRARYGDAASIMAFTERAQQALRDIPGVSGVSGASQMPFTGNAYHDVFVRPEIGEQGANNPFSRFESVTRDFWTVAGVPILAGRTFTADDRSTSPRVVVINQVAASKFFGADSPVGRHIQYNRHDWLVIGVVGAMRMEDPGTPAPPVVYLSAAQQESWPGYVMIKSSQPLATVITAAQAAVRNIDPTIALTEVRSLDDRVTAAMAPQRFRAAVTGALGLLALLLSTIGIYGVISHAVGRETRDIGVRLALGEDRARVRRGVLARALQPTLIGVGIGCILALIAGQWLAAFLVGGAARDPWALAFAAGCLLSAAAAAAYFPARRASGVDPMIALRSD